MTDPHRAQRMGPPTLAESGARAVRITTRWDPEDAERLAEAAWDRDILHGGEGAPGKLIRAVVLAWLDGKRLP